MNELQSNPQPVEICFLFPLNGKLIEVSRKRRKQIIIFPSPCIIIRPEMLLFCWFFLLPGLVEAWTSPQAEFGLLPAIRSL